MSFHDIENPTGGMPMERVAGLNRSGPWAMSRRLAAQTGLTNQCLKEQGLLSVKELWVKIHYPATAR